MSPILQNLVEMTGHRDHLRLEVSVLSTLQELAGILEVRALEVFSCDGALHVRPRTWLENGRWFKDKVSHVHVKDVSQSLAASMRGELTGIAVSATAIGDGVNTDNIRRCFDILADIGYDGIVSIECEGQGGPMIEKSLAWVRELVDDANQRMSK